MAIDELHTVTDIPVGDVTLDGELAVPADDAGLVIFAHGSGNDILRAVNRAEQSSANSRAEPDDGAVSSVGVSVGLRLAGGNIPVTVDGTRVCALFVGTVRA